MPTVNDLIRKRLLVNVVDRVPPPDELRKTERNKEFDILCMNRKILGAMRYGLMGQEGKPEYDRVSCMIKRLQKYQNDQNKEHLIDVANLAELEFVEGHGIMKPIDDGEHTKEV